MINRSQLEYDKKIGEWSESVIDYFERECSVCLRDISNYNVYHIGGEPKKLNKKTGVVLCNDCDNIYNNCIGVGELPAKESKFTNKVGKLFDSTDDIVMPKIHGGAMQKTGLPDFMGVAYGEPVALELKLHPKKPEKIQRHILKNFKRAGGRAYVGYSLKQIKQLMKSLRSDYNE